MELDSRHLGSPSSVQPLDSITMNITSETTSTEIIPRKILKLLSAGFSFFVAGANDGSLGALIPYMLQAYSINTTLVAVIYLSTFTGWLLCALTNSHASQFFGIGALLSLGAALQLLSHALRAWQPPFALFILTFFTQGLGMAYQDSHANTFVSSVHGAHRWLGFIHAMYGLGCLVSPFVATAIASRWTERWCLFYLFPLGLSVLNVGLVLFAFWESVVFIGSARGGELGEGTVGQERRGRNRSAMVEVRQMIGMRDVWLLSLFFFFYLGAGATSGGWVVEYLVRVRQGNLGTVGYIPTAFYGGLCLGRLLLAEPTHRFGERWMLLLYALLCLVMQLIFWLVPNIIASAITFSLMGFFLGPFFAAGISVASKLFPKQVQPAALGLIFVVAQAGSALFPSLTGVIATRAGVQVLQPIVAGLIAAMGVTWVFVPKVSTHED